MRGQRRGPSTDLGWAFSGSVLRDPCASTSCGVVQVVGGCAPSAPTPAPTPAQTLVKVASSVTLEGIVATEFNADEGMKAAFAQSILDSAKGAFDEVIDIEAVGRRRRLDDGAGVGVSYTGVARVDGTEDAASVGADLLEQASDALTAAFDDGSFLTTLQAADTAFAAVTVDVAATQTALADAALEVIVTTPSPTLAARRFDAPTWPRRRRRPATALDRRPRDTTTIALSDNGHTDDAAVAAAVALSVDGRADDGRAVPAAVYE